MSFGDRFLSGKRHKTGPRSSPQMRLQDIPPPDGDIVNGEAESSPPPSVSTQGIDDTFIGQLLVRSGVLDAEEVRKVLAKQQEEHLHFGEAAMQMGFVTPTELQNALSQQFSYPVLKSGESALSSSLYAAYDPAGRRAEALRTLRTQLMLRWFKDQSKILAVLEPRAGAGSSELAANLAIVFAQLGERTLIVDANFRNPVQHKLFGFNNSADLGLSNVLVGRSSLKKVLRTIPPFDRLSLLSAGPMPPNPLELLGRVNFSYVMETAPSVFDVVIVDAPPVIDYADAQVVAARAGASLLVARRDKTRINDLQRAAAQLAPSGAQLLGAVMCGC
ncbi:MAG: chain length determinant protein tyrosine kinase EpsG [Steroidobacteraceae bacterium]